MVRDGTVTGREGVRKGQRNRDSDSRTQTQGGIERQGHCHRDWDREIGTGTKTEGHQ